MNKKILAIGSIIACIIILLASLSPVVGYDIVRSSMRDSQLFSIRTKRAIDEEENALTCDYVGRGDLMPFPSRDSKTVLFQKIIDRIYRMDEKEFNIFKNTLMSRLYQNDKIQDIDVSEIITAFQYLKQNPSIISNLANKDNLRFVDYSAKNPFLCLLVDIIAGILFLAFLGIYFLVSLAPEIECWSVRPAGCPSLINPNCFN